MANMANKTSPKKASRRSEAREGGKHADAPRTDNDHQKTVSGKNQKGPAVKAGKDAGGNQGSKGQNLRKPTQEGSSVGSHKPGGDGPGTKKFKHEHDDEKRRRR